jgi:DNA polymerase III alpha subunit
MAKVLLPLEFMFAFLRTRKIRILRTEYLIEAKRMGIPIRLPHVNDSDVQTLRLRVNGIRFGLSAIKFISDNIAAKIYRG